MANAQAQYSPRQLLESARRAEVDGNVDLAAHVARYVIEHFAGSPESGEAYASLIRLGRAPHEHGYQTTGAAAHAGTVQAFHGQPLQAQNGHGHNGHAAGQNGYGAATVQTRLMNGGNGQGYAPTHPAAASIWSTVNGPGTGEANGHAAPHANGHLNGHANGHANGAVTHYAAPQVVRAQVPAPLPAPAAAASANGYTGFMQTPVQAIAATFAPAAPYRGDSEPPPPAVIHHAPEAKRQYRGGRFIARFTFTAGWIMILAGLLSPVPALLGLVGAAPSVLGAALVAGALMAGGLIALLGGQTATAVFDQADSMRELVELERTRWEG